MQAAFSATPTTGTVPLTVAFTDESSAGATSWAWDFEANGTIDSTAQHPTFTYTSPGTYSVSLSVAGPSGSDAVTQASLIVVAATSGTPQDAIFTPIADAQIRDTSPTTNWWNYPTMRVRTSSETYRSYVKFDVAGISGQINSAVLRVFSTDGGPDAGGVWKTSNAWTETGLTWNTAPAPTGSQLDGGGLIGDNVWREFDVTSAVTAQGIVSFYMASPNSNSVYWSTKEGVEPPQLVVTVDGSVAPPTAAFTTTMTTGQAPMMVGFQDQSTGNPSAWAWDIDGDGSTDSTQRSPYLAYEQPGTYSVSLRVTNAGGSSTLTKPMLITVGEPPAASAGDPVLVGAGDIADCGSPGDEATATLLDGIAGTVFAAGDTVYELGTATEFAQCYEPTWGRHKARTWATPGNHEYETAGAAPFFAYFGARAGASGTGYYSFDLGTWHIVVLNTNCTEIGGCGTGSAQDTWLAQDLAANPDACIGVIGHNPRFHASGTTTNLAALWQRLQDAGAEFYISGDDHRYERYARKSPTGALSPTGIRQFIIGTGGTSLSGLGVAALGTEFRSNASYGVQKFTLHASGYSWEFVPTAAGTVADVGSESCH
jgi:PKD repeat protein